MQSSKSLKFTALAFATALATVAASTSALAADGVRVRGTVVSVTGDTLLVKSREGADVSIKLNLGWKAGGIAKATLADIKQGTSSASRRCPAPAGPTARSRF